VNINNKEVKISNTIINGEIYTLVEVDDDFGCKHGVSIRNKKGEEVAYFEYLDEDCDTDSAITFIQSV
jgi:hypothetical protein